jgi:hypothetical protein
MIQGTSARGKARSITLVLTVVAAVAVAVACTPASRSNGESCIKDQDCLSGVCSQTVCVAAPNYIDAEVNGDGGTLDGTTASEAAAGDSSTASETSTGPESGTTADTGTAAETGPTDSGTASDTGSE